MAKPDAVIRPKTIHTFYRLHASSSLAQGKDALASTKPTLPAAFATRVQRPADTGAASGAAATTATAAQRLRPPPAAAVVVVAAPASSVSVASAALVYDDRYYHHATTTTTTSCRARRTTASTVHRQRHDVPLQHAHRATTGGCDTTSVPTARTRSCPSGKCAAAT